MELKSFCMPTPREYLTSRLHQLDLEVLAAATDIIV